MLKLFRKKNKESRKNLDRFLFNTFTFELITILALCKHWITLFLLILSQVVLSQQPAVIQLTEKDGLPDIEFYNIIEDQQNYIWLAADKGLYRYNGRAFKHFIHPDQKGNAVFGVQEDRKGLVWCNNISGQFFFVEDQQLKLFIDLGSRLKGQLAEFLLTEEELIVLPGKNIIRVDLKTKVVRENTVQQDILIGSVQRTPKGYLFSRQDHIIKADDCFSARDSLQLKALVDYNTEFQISKRVKISSHDQVELCHFYKLGKNYFYKFSIEDAYHHPIQVPPLLKPRTINHTFFYKDQIWFSTDQGLFLCELVEDQLLLKKRLFSEKFITKVIRDHESNYWITTKGDGILVIPNINIFQHNYAKGKLNISKFERINDQMLVFGTNDGKVGLFDLQKFRYRLIDTSSAYWVSEITRFPSSQETFVIKEDKVLTLNNRTLRLKSANTPEIQGAKSFSKINDTTYILSSYKQAVFVDKSFNISKTLIGKRSYINYHSEKNATTFVGTVEGLYILDRTFQIQEIRYQNKPILAQNIVELDNGDVWVATFNDGVFGIRNHAVFANYKKGESLLSNSISAMKNDANSLWIATDQGVQYFNTITETFKNLTKQNGIPSYRISDIEICDESIFFATNTGIFSLDKNKAFKHAKIPKVYISDVSIGLQSVSLKKNYTLSHNNNSIKISYNSNGFQSFIHNKYEFRLLGQSPVWQTDEDNANAVSFYSLPSGEYTFQVKSVLADKNDVNAIDSIHFTISLPFWKQWWFYGFLILSISLLMYVAVKMKIDKLKRKQTEALQKELVNKQLILSQLENLRSQMNPHFIFNALNSIQEYIVFNEKELATSYLVKFSRLIRIYLEHSQENEVLLSEEIHALEIYLELEKNRFEDLLHYEIHISDEVDAQRIKIPSLFIQPYVENALKHGLLHKTEDRRLRVDFSLNKEDNILYCKISDNGIGIEASKRINQQKNAKHKSFALSANQRRVDLLNFNRSRKITVETFDLANKEATGTEVIITIPI
jgi:sensor histidine kinase YesM